MYQYLDNVKGTEDLRQLNQQQITGLCGDIRDFLVQKVSATGGHLASNLGVVELTVALHRVYDPKKDRIVFDVGHQCYVHKLFTGRKDRFDTLRQKDGLSGFPRPYEAEEDAFTGGHASNSISAALGMAKARTLMGENYDVVAVIGDGSLTGGLAFEGLSNAAASNESIVIVLNDNEMAISENVGGMSLALQKLRVSPQYLGFKQWYRKALKNVPQLYHVAHDVKEMIKHEVLPENVFTQLGLTYFGPVDGHDEASVEAALHWAKEQGKPVLLHIVTVKGKGVSYAEEAPQMYHGVGPFDPETGTVAKASRGYSNVLGDILTEYAHKDRKIVAVTAAMADGTGLNRFASEFPLRFIDTGICEEHAVTMCGAMAKQGMLPVFAVYSTFLQRSYDMLIHDVALNKEHVVFCVDRAGFVGSDGETHQGTFDISFLRTIPGMTILCPASYGELRTMLWDALYKIEGPVAVRYPRGSEGNYKDVNTGREAVLCSGTDVTIAVYGDLVNEALAAAELAEAQGVHAEIIKIGRIDNSAYPQLMTSLKKTRKLITVEDGCENGSFGQYYLSLCVKQGIEIQAAKCLNSGDGVVPQGTISQLRSMYGIDAEGIRTAILELAGEKNG